MKQIVITERENIVAIADAVRANSDITGEISLDGIVGGINYVANYVASNTGGVDTSDATASADDILSGKTAYTNGGKVTGTIPTMAGATITPTTSERTAVMSGVYTTGEVKVAAIPERYVDVSEATASESDVMSGKTYGSGTSVKTGTFTLDSELTTQDDLIAQIQTALESKAGGSAEPVLQTKTITPTTSTQTVTADSGYDGLSKVTVGAMPTATQATPTISVNSSGLITASATQTAGYVAAGTKSGTKQLTTKASTTYTPTTSNQIISSGTYLTGVQTIKGDANLKAENIAEGVSIFGVTGTHSGGGSVETCTVTFTVSGGTCYYVDGDTMEQKTISTTNSTIKVPTNSIIAMTAWNWMINASGSCTQLFYNQLHAAYFVSGNCSFNLLDEPA